MIAGRDPTTSVTTALAGGPEVIVEILPDLEVAGADRFAPLEDAENLAAPHRCVSESTGSSTPSTAPRPRLNPPIETLVVLVFLADEAGARKPR